MIGNKLLQINTEKSLPGRAPAQPDRRDPWIAVVVLVLMLLLTPLVGKIAAHFSVERWCWFDEGTIAYTAARADLGEIPHLAFPYYYFGGFEILLGMAMRLFGATLGVVQWSLGVCMAMTAGVVYVLHRSLGVDRVTGALVSLVVVGSSYILDYHIFPAWFAIGVIFLSVIFMMIALAEDRAWDIFAAGVCLGIATAFKQSSGAFAGCAFTLTLAYLGAFRVSTNQVRPDKEGWSTGSVILFAITLVLPAVAVIALAYILRAHLSLLNVAMFLTLPGCIALLGITGTWRVGKRSPAAARALFRWEAKGLGVLVGGSLVGLSPFLLYFGANGGIPRLLTDAFVGAQASVVGHYRSFDFTDPDSLAHVPTMIRRLAVFIVPLISVVVGFTLGSARIRMGFADRASILLVLSSTMLSILYMTLYPNPSLVHILFLMPLIALPFAYVLDRLLKRQLKNDLARGVAVLGLLLVFAGVYAGQRYISGDLGKKMAVEVVMLDSDRGNAYVPVSVREYIGPAVSYLKSRPAGESFLGYDLYNKTIAFLSGRAVAVDYFQRHLYYEVTPDDLRAVADVAEERKIDTIVLGKEYLTEDASRQTLMHYLDAHYTLAVDAPALLIYQRNKSASAN